MPELPEMEIYRANLSKTVTQLPITEVTIHREKTVNTSASDFVRAVQGNPITAVDRRGKHLLLRLKSGHTLLLHLMLGGWMYLGSQTDVPAHSSQVTFQFENGHTLYFLGLRLGYLHLYTTEQVDEKLSKLGPEPFNPDFNLTTFQNRLRRHRGPVKFVLTNQHCIAGIGNCYADEMCFGAGIRPLKPVPDLDSDAYEKLYHQMHHTLTRAINLGGYMEHPYTVDDKQTGGYNAHCLVYDRGDEPCPRCHHPITQTTHANRKVFFCSNCQH